MSEREMKTLIAMLEKQIGMSWADIVDWLRSQNSVDAIERLIATRGMSGQPLQMVDAAAKKFAADLHSAYVQAGQRTAQWLDNQPELSDKLIRFDITNPHAVRRAEMNRYELVRGLTEEQRTVTRNVLVDGMRRGANPREVARDLRNSIGLTPNQDEHVRNYRRSLEQGDWNDALGRELRDGRSDRLLRKLRAGDKEARLSEGQVDSLVDRYRSNYVTYRAETIARTEGSSVAHAGSADAIRQAIDRGDIKANALVKEWMAGPRTKDARPEHHAMDRKTKSYDQPFVFPDGVRMMYPGDPAGGAKHNASCRCTIATTISV